jgi:transcriptional regulator with XRE-family HTH domain
LKQDHEMTRLVPATCRAARALLDWTQEDLATAAGVCRSTVREFEKGRHALQHASEDSIIRALAASGVDLLTKEDGGPGVRLKGTRS